MSTDHARPSDPRDQDHLGVEVLYRSANSPENLPPEEAQTPFQPGTTVFPKGSVNDEGALPLPVDIRLDRDVAIPLTDGTTLFGDIYRPTTDEKVPVILVWTPYTKNGGWANHNMQAHKFGTPRDHLSGLQAFEAPDPGYWVQYGYAIAVVDTRGTGHSEGDQLWWGRAAGRDVYDTIEWLGTQDWTNGKVGMAGNSQLAILQWFAAAEQPPHLGAIAPWEGLTDMYRDDTGRGGIPDTTFQDRDIMAYIHGKARTEDCPAMMAAHPLMNAYWEDKRARLEQIEVPAYIVASWTNPLHTRGTMKAFREISSKDKWLRVHNVMEWTDLADLDNVADLRRFFDRFLKGLDNGWEATPRVRLSVLDPGGEDKVGRAENEWPPARQQWRTLHLDASSNTLSDKAPTQESVARYQGDDLESSVKFTYTAQKDTEITGHLNLHLWVETEDADDADLFAAVYKTDAQGRRLYHITVTGEQRAGLAAAAAQGVLLPAMLAYSGPVGRIRASHRALDLERSTPSEPYLLHTREDLLTLGEPVAVELGLWPTSMVLHAGETLVVEIGGHPVGDLAADGPLPGGDLDIPTRNKGAYLIRTGGAYDSHLLLPVVP
ncbi:CocE/NonD family hydrolase [Streptomyces graminofaciens]|uniref:CocE/NonD family hydrolase n=1 Tax=Streptomyces graminofaciens TaxID=68212 RepID=UPI002572EEDB|nr:CocE/NonD family hydrolase [Streptomyces graminofaciens]